MVLAYAGEPKESLAAIATALRLDPKPSRNVRDLTGTAFFVTREYQRAIQLFEEADPGRLSESAYIYLACAYARAGEIEKARATLAPMIEKDPIYMNQRYFAVGLDVFAREDDRRHFLDTLPMTGLPEWPYAFRGDPADRIGGEALRDLVVGRTWQGMHANGAEFFQLVDDRSQLVYRSAASFLTGRAFVEGDEFCFALTAYMHGRKLFGEVYRNRIGNGFPYLHVSPEALRYFPVETRG